ncbi:MAG: hypothetical protein R6U10_00980 [Thermoplasmatota archaeon]
MIPTSETRIIGNIATTRHRILAVVKTLYSKEPLTSHKISKETGINYNTIASTFTILKKINIIKYDDDTGKYTLSDIGRSLAENIMSGDTWNLQRQGKYIMEHFPEIKHAVDIYNEKKDIGYKELGKEVSSRLELEWDERKMHRNGRGLYGILSVFGLAEGKKRTGREKIHRRDVESKLVPAITMGQILDTFKSIDSNRFTVKDLVDVTERQEGTNKTIISQLNDLGLVNKINNHLELSEHGIEFKENIDTSQGEEIFGDVLLSYYPIRLFLRQHIKDKSFDSYKLGKELTKYNFAYEWSEKTQEIYGQRFLSWLTYGKLVKPYKDKYILSAKSKIELGLSEEKTKERQYKEKLPVITDRKEDEVVQDIKELRNLFTYLLVEQDKDEYINDIKEKGNNIIEKIDNNMVKLNLEMIVKNTKNIPVVDTIKYLVQIEKYMKGNAPVT